MEVELVGADGAVEVGTLAEGLDGGLGGEGCGGARGGSATGGTGVRLAK